MQTFVWNVPVSNLGTVAILVEVLHSFSQPLQATLVHYPDYATTASFYIVQSSSVTSHLPFDAI